MTKIFNPRSKAIFIYGKENHSNHEIENGYFVFYKNKKSDLRQAIDERLDENPTIFIFNKMENPTFGEPVLVLDFYNKSKASNKFLFFNHLNQEIQYLMPAAPKRPYFIHFLSDGSKMTKIIRSFNRLLFNFGLKRLVCDGSFSVSGRLPFWFEEKQFFCFQIGTGKVDMILLATGNELYPDHYVKVPITQEGSLLVSQEAEILNYLQTADFEYLDVPKVVEYRQRLVITNICPATQLSNNELTSTHLRAIKELYDFTFVEKRLGSLKVWEQTIDDLLLLEKRISETSGSIKSKLKGASKILWLIKEEFSENEILPTTLAHGDFIKENTFVSEEKIHVIDWKNSERLLVFYDLFHFIIMTDLSTDKSAFHVIYDKIEQIFWDNNFLKNFEEYQLDWKRSFRFYLLKTVPRFLMEIQDFGNLDANNKLKVERMIEGLHFVASKQLAVRSLR